jgi:hypothetical protein
VYLDQLYLLNSTYTVSGWLNTEGLHGPWSNTFGTSL